MPKQMLALLGSGTSANESLHKEIDSWYRNRGPEVFPTTLELQMQVGALGKLLTHNAALYSPTLRQWSHDECRAVMGAQLDLFQTPAWAIWCGERHSSSFRSARKAVLPLAWKRQALQQAIRKHQQGVVKRLKTKLVLVKRPAAPPGLAKRPAGVLKRPAGVLKQPASSWEVAVVQTAEPATKTLKRTPFNRKRVW